MKGPDWFVPLSQVTAAVPELFAFPQAGAGCATVSPLADALAPEVALTALNLPGRQARFADPPCTDLDVLIDELVGAFPAARRPVLFGYCSGALLAFLLARALHDRGLPGPSALIVTSFAAPHLVAPSQELHTLDSDGFWNEILSYGGVPPQLAAHPDLRRVFEAPLRADYALLAGYTYTEAPPLAVPILALHGRDDPTLPREAVAAWATHSTGAFTVRALPGSHLLLADSLPAVAAAIRDHVSERGV